jgi:hypothetical protein
LTLQYRFEVVVLSHPCVPEHRRIVLALVFNRLPVLLTQVQVVRRGHLREKHEARDVSAGHTDTKLDITEHACRVGDLS